MICRAVLVLVVVLTLTQAELQILLFALRKFNQDVAVHRVVSQPKVVMVMKDYTASSFIFDLYPMPMVIKRPDPHPPQSYT